MSNRNDRHVAVVRCQAVDLGETIKALVHLAREQGHVTYDDVNGIVPDGVSPDALDELYAELLERDIKVVEFVDEHTKPADGEEDQDHRLDALDDPVRMYMNQMGKVPLLTREQEVEVFQRIEQAECDVKRLIYGFGFAGTEHSAIAERLLSEPPTERFDRVVVDQKVSTRKSHLKGLRGLCRSCVSIRS
jgi:RNA polymerase primary sigma factor